MDGETIFTGLLVLLIGVILGFGTLFFVKGVKAESSCAALGFPQSTVTYNLDVYCIKRVNQTDSVVLLSKLQK